MTDESDTLIRVFICGSALRGQPDHANLGDALFIAESRTRPVFRLHAVQDGLHPGIHQVKEAGISIPGEIYAMTPAQYADLEASEPPNMYAQEVELADGSTAIVFLYPKALIEEHRWPDISHYGGWVAYKSAAGH